MKKHTKEELMISERKKAKKGRPQPGELVQGIFFPIFKAKENFSAAVLLFKNNQPSNAVNLFLHGVEELSKSFHFFQLLLSWDKPEKINQYIKNQKNHIQKLELIFPLLNMIEVMNMIINKSRKSSSKELEPETKNDKMVKIALFWEEEGMEWVLNPDKEYIKKRKIFEQQTLLAENLLPKDLLDRKSIDTTVLERLKSKLADKYHTLRLQTSYTDFKDETVKSPYHCLQEIDIELYENLVSMFNQLLGLFIQSVESYIPIYLKPIKECYYSSDKNKTKALKEEINRRVKRTLPAVRLYMDRFYKHKIEKDIDKYSEKERKQMEKILKEMPTKEQKTIFISLIKKINDLIMSHSKIEEIYHYPPLKKRAKEYYSQFRAQEPN